MTDVEVTYNPEIVRCPYCGREEKGEKLKRRTDTERNIDLLEKRAKNNKKVNEAIQKFREGKIDAYEFFKTIETVNRSEDKEKIFSSNFDGEAEGDCKCGSPIKARVLARVTVEREDFRSSLDDYRQLPIPGEKVLARLLRTGEVFLSEEAYTNLLKLEAWGREIGDKEKFEAKRDEIRKETSLSLEYVKSLMEKPADVDGFIAQTLENLEKTNLRNDLKNEVRQFFIDLKDYVKKTHDREFSLFLNALQRLARQDAYSM